MTGRIDGDAKERLRQLVLGQGFARAGFAGAEPVPDAVGPWVAAGRHASLAYMAREPAARADPRTLLPGARSLVCAGAVYPRSDGTGAIAAYARGDDYHRTLRAALQRVVGALAAEHPRATFRVCVDTAPLQERAFAARAGLGWIGRSTLLLDEHHGPWMLLGEIVTDLEIAPDAPAAGRCGTCTACVDACPTGALDAHGLDARKCLSYWTIEHRGALPAEWAARLDGHAFGCDDCLVACPFGDGRVARSASGSAPTSASAGADAPVPAVIPEAPFVPRPELGRLTLDEIEARARESFRRHFGRTPMAHTRKGGLLRNLAAIRAGAGRTRSRDGDANNAGPASVPAPGPGPASDGRTPGV
ncbi:MAG: tRNA epoxyqueuosine(34) reductase QueG [Planctomycetes bacterium]|nr:tRNA epoxyqueuosine(34) reductase QueG [Planctomycetota bacterium]